MGKKLIKREENKLAHLEIVNYNNDTCDDELNVDSNESANVNKEDLRKVSKTQQAAKRIVKKCKNLKRKKPYQRFDKKIEDDVVFLKQSPLHPRGRLRKKLIKSEENEPVEVEFVKQVLVHPRDRLKRKRKGELINYSELSNRSKSDGVTLIKQVPVHPRRRLKKLAAHNDKVKFLKQVPSHPRDRLKRTVKSLKQQAQIGRDNVSRMMRGEFSFSPAKILNKTLIFDTLKINGEEIMDRIIDALNDKYNDEFYIEHPESSNYFTLKREDGQQKTIQKAKNIFTSLKNDPNSVLFSEEKIDTRFLKQLKNSTYDKDSLLLKLILLADSKLDESKVPTRVDFVGKREMDRSTLYNFDKSFQLVHADVGNLELTIPRYVLLVVDLYSSKVYVYPMH